MKADIEIVREVKMGNRAAYSELVRRHQKEMLRLALRFMQDLDAAEDVVQDSFVKAYQKLHMFEEKSSFKSWLYRITINTAKNKIRDEHREVMGIDNISISVGPQAENELVIEAIKQKLQAAVNQLPERQKTALILRVYEDMSFKEIAHIMECPYDTAKANFRHALLKLKESVEEKEMLGRWFETEDYLEYVTVSHTPSAE